MLKAIIRYILGDIRFGRATGTGVQNATSVNAKATNMGGGFLKSTTPSSANTEFAIAHNFGRVPYGIMPYVPLDQVGASVPRLTVSRAADSSNIYLKSPDTSLAFYLYIEG